MKVNHSSQWGFSLIEIMVVMLVIGLGVGVATVGLMQPDPASRLKDYGEDFYSQLSWARDEALLTGEHIGMVPELVGNEPGGRNDGQGVWQLLWHRWRDGEWMPLELEPLIPPRGMLVELEIDEQPVDLWRWLEYDKPLPAAVFYGGGEATPAVWIVRLEEELAREVEEFEDRQLHMVMDELGRIIWVERSDLDRWGGDESDLVERYRR
ncbi:hypothetical protein GCM10007877_28350 [Marinibactrum halimedae]|uniref:Type II secretion system protein GspH n=2 Tax=Marinibactrum halimedae TaxID=1444977 RepID=A0AA37TB05_9GAMM|nr:hypothetical protein GCM10007877_28350 [Marinibactrum halimedae]